MPPYILKIQRLRDIGVGQWLSKPGFQTPTSPALMSGIINFLIIPNYRQSGNSSILNNISVFLSSLQHNITSKVINSKEV